MSSPSEFPLSLGFCWARRPSSRVHLVWWVRARRRRSRLNQQSDLCSPFTGGAGSVGAYAALRFDCCCISGEIRGGELPACRSSPRRWSLWRPRKQLVLFLLSLTNSAVRPANVLCNGSVAQIAHAPVKPRLLLWARYIHPPISAGAIKGHSSATHDGNSAVFHL